MPTLILCTSIYEGSRFHFAGETFDSVNDAKTIVTLQAAGAVLVDSTNGAAAAAGALARVVHSKQAGRPELCTAIMMGAIVDQGCNLPKALLGAGTAQTPDLTSAKRFVEPAATLAGATVITLQVPTHASQASGLFPVYQGTRREFTRLDVTANTLAFLNGGPAAGTLATLVASKLGYAMVEWNGTDWELVDCSAT
jgi:hypothetical protein